MGRGEDDESIKETLESSRKAAAMFSGLPSFTVTRFYVLRFYLVRGEAGPGDGRRMYDGTWRGGNADTRIGILVPFFSRVTRNRSSVLRRVLNVPRVFTSYPVRVYYRVYRDSRIAAPVIFRSGRGVAAFLIT